MRLLIITLLFLSACAPAPASKLATDAVSRRIIGPVVAVPLEAPQDAESITHSLAATRARAWETFAKVVQDSDRSIPRPDGSVVALSLPTLFTWYSPEDVNRLMGFSLAQIDDEDFARGRLLTSQEWAESQRLLDEEFDTLPLPLQKKWARFFESNPVVDRASVIGATGMNRTLFSPDLIASVTRQYADLQKCFPNDVKPAAEEPYRSCWSEPLPRSSVLIKTTWVNSEAAFRKVDTDAASMARLMAAPDSSWETAKVTAPLPENIVKATVNGKAFVLGGIHIVSKQLDDWLWISAWWSDDPDHDFGEDRPEAVKRLGSPWNHYKICAVSSYSQDPGELDRMAATHPTLAAAYRAILDESGTSWCSNPYIERGVNNQRTNCIGCHQFAGTDITQEEVMSDPLRFPHFGKTKQREDFPSDYIWAATQGQVSWLQTLDTLRFPSRAVSR